MIGSSGDVSFPLVLVNGERVVSDAAAVSVRDRGFTLADGLFETMRARGGIVFRLDRHLARLSDGLRLLQIAEPRDLRRWIENAVAPLSPTDVSIRVTVTRGPGPGGLAPPADPRPTVVVTVSPMPTFPPETYEQGLRVVVASGRRNVHAMTAGLKTLAYTDAILAWLEAQRAGANEAILLDTDGHCSEATASNLFIYRHGALMTPPVSCAALPGITRAAVMELAGSLDLRAEERAFDMGALAAAEEVFLTSSLRGIAPVQSVNGQPIGAGRPGPVTARVTRAYQALVDRECGRA